MNLQEYAERMASSVRSEVADLREEIDTHRKAIDDAQADIEVWQGRCPHINLKHYPRQIAEDHDWSKCLDCGAEIV